MITKRLNEHDNLDPWLIARGAIFTQGLTYASWQRAMGRKVIREVISAPGEAIYYQIIKYPLPLGKSYLYIPHGPITSPQTSAELWEKFIERLKKISQEEKAIFVRFDSHPNNPPSEISKQFLKLAPENSYHGSNFQPQYEWLIDLKKNPEEILLSFSKKTRYAIRTANDRGVRVKIISQNLAEKSAPFYKLLSETADRGHFSLHPQSYYQNILHITEARGDGFLIIAEKNDFPLVASFVQVFGKQALFVFSGSSSSDRATNAPYLAQWETIKYLKKIGVESYSLGGIAPEDDPKYSGWEGLGKFKRNFTGRLLEFNPFFDFINQPLWYYLYLLRRLLKKH